MKPPVLPAPRRPDAPDTGAARAGATAAAAPAAAARRPARRRHPRSVYVRRRIVVGTLALGVLLVVAIVAFAVFSFADLMTGLHRSDLASAAGGDQNILVMGLDSRLDENGDALPAATYNALHAGSQDDGGYNANVLMLIHIPADGGKAVGISIPRDDYVPLSGKPDGVSQSKIKEAYGLELDQKLTELMKAGKLSRADAYQEARAAARRTEIATVSAFLGGVPINHFIEVTMAAFYQVAQAVQPVTVCIAEDTKDPYSGADFTAGVQQLSASQAVSFVRQRRDESNPSLNFTDLDRERRQQAFIVSLATKLKKADTFANPATLESLISAAKQNIALDSGLNLLDFASDASHFAGGNITFDTLPIAGYGVRDGQDVNLVDTKQIHATVRQLLNPATASPAPAAPAKSSTSKGSGSSGSGAAQSSGSAPAAPAPAAPNGTYTDPTAPLPSGGVPCVK
ncbi:LCP family protein [Leifsonia shinshuensis]|uniref:LCP family protein required for cell wall assembly n=1 Tax=Leifsonia shinshuensis TaxID=150026 RepID=A0A853CUY4_9MICO|nr:LCP family protein required for cell wall assembly [Leifsonia shinshuensis]